MYKMSTKAMFALFKFGFTIGLKRTTTLPDKILGEELEKWIKKHLENRDE